MILNSSITKGIGKEFIKATKSNPGGLPFVVKMILSLSLFLVSKKLQPNNDEIQRRLSAFGLLIGSI